MAGYGFSKRSVQRIQRVVRKVETADQSSQRDNRTRPGRVVRTVVVGKLTSTLIRSGAATLALFAAAQTLTEDLGESLEVIDVGQLPDGTTLPLDTVVTAAWCDGVYVVIAYDCDAGE